MTSHKKSHPALLGISLLLVAVACFAVLDTTTKRVTMVVPVMMAIWARYFFKPCSPPPWCCRSKAWMF